MPDAATLMERHWGIALIYVWFAKFGEQSVNLEFGKLIICVLFYFAEFELFVGLMT